MCKLFSLNKRKTKIIACKANAIDLSNRLESQCESNRLCVVYEFIFKFIFEFTTYWIHMELFCFTVNVEFHFKKLFGI